MLLCIYIFFLQYGPEIIINAQHTAGAEIVRDDYYIFISVQSSVSTLFKTNN